MNTQFGRKQHRESQCSFQRSQKTGTNIEHVRLVLRLSFPPQPDEFYGCLTPHSCIPIHLNALHVFYPQANGN